jgi:small nuclear ribonucleoprotein E
VDQAARGARRRSAPAMASTKVQRIMTQPINLIFRFLQSKARIQIWLFEQKDLRIEGRIIGFDEYMNLVLDDAEEINVKKSTRKSLGRILLKGDNITLMMNTGK